MDKLHFRNYVIARETPSRLMLQNIYVCSDSMLVTRSTVEYAIQNLQDPAEFKDLYLLSSSYLGCMSGDTFNHYSEAIDIGIDSFESHFYLLTWRSLSNTVSVVISKATQLITLPTIQEVKSREHLDDFVLVGVEYLGFMTKKIFESLPVSENIKYCHP